MTTRRLALVSSGALLAGCDRAASTLDPVGPRAAEVAQLWWIMLALGGAVSAIVTMLIVIAVLRNRSSASRPPPLVPEDPRATERGQRMILIGGVVVPLFVLSLTVFFTIRTTNAIYTPPAPARFTIEIIGHMWWWEVRYPDHGFVTANEVRVPIGEPVELRLRTADVIHSFWVPQVQGKLDLIPGRVTSTWLQVDRPGVYRGPCAEFCGVQHAHMELRLVGEQPEQFAAWLALQQLPAIEPDTPLARRGAQVYARVGCIQCHAINYGVAAPARIGGEEGPDLTHLGSRLTLGAGMLPNTRGNLAGWVANPQAIKPGNMMPVIELGSEELQALLAYLESLR